MADLKALEREYLYATRPSALDIPKARACLDSLREAGADQSLIVLFEAKLLQHEFPNRRDEALRTLIDLLASETIVDPTTIARTCVMASKFAMMLYDRHSLEYVLTHAERLWPVYAEEYEVMRWRAVIEMNAGILYARINNFSEATRRFEAMLATYTRTVENFCWLTQANVYLAVIHAKNGNVAQARHHADEAAKTGMPYDETERIYAQGEIFLAEKRYEDARSLLRQSYALAKKASEPMVMADAQLALCEVYKQVANFDAFWYAHERAGDVAKGNGMTHVLDALGRISEGVPNT